MCITLLVNKKSNKDLKKILQNFLLTKKYMDFDFDFKPYGFLKNAINKKYLLTPIYRSSLLDNIYKIRGNILDFQMKFLDNNLHEEKEKLSYDKKDFSSKIQRKITDNNSSFMNSYIYDTEFTSNNLGSNILNYRNFMNTSFNYGSLSYIYNSNSFIDQNNFYYGSYYFGSYFSYNSFISSNYNSYISYYNGFISNYYNYNNLPYGLNMGKKYKLNIGYPNIKLYDEIIKKIFFENVNKLPKYIIPEYFSSGYGLELLTDN